MYCVALTGEPDDVYDKGEGNAEGVACEETQEGGLPFSVEGDAAYFEEDGFDGPDEEDRKDGELGGPGVGNGKANRVEGPPGKAVMEEGEEGHDAAANAEDAQTFQADIKGASKLRCGEVEGEAAGAGEGPGVEVEGTVFVAEVHGEEEVRDQAQEDDEYEGGDEAFAVFANEVGQAGGVYEGDHEGAFALGDEAVGEAHASDAGGREVPSADGVKGEVLFGQGGAHVGQAGFGDDAGHGQVVDDEGRNEEGDEFALHAQPEAEGADEEEAGQQADDGGAVGEEFFAVVCGGFSEGGGEDDFDVGASGPEVPEDKDGECAKALPGGDFGFGGEVGGFGCNGVAHAVDDAVFHPEDEKEKPDREEDVEVGKVSQAGGQEIDAGVDAGETFGKDNPLSGDGHFGY